MTVKQQWVVAFISAPIVIAVLLSPAPQRPLDVTFQSCDEAREIGATLPLTPADPGWNPRLDPDGDGRAC